MKWYQNLGLTGKLVVPLLIVFPLIIAFQFMYVGQQSRKNAVEIATDSAKSTIEQYKILRSYYTKNIVKKIKKSGGELKFHFDHQGVDNTLPLPATVIQDLSSELSKSSSDVKLSLYSDKPFPNRKSRKLDSFQKEAFKMLQKNPDTPFAKETIVGGSPVVRVAIGDKLVAKACVSCHNAHPQTPFNQWKLGDLRGVLEVQIPIEKSLEAGNNLAASMGWTVFLSGLLVAALIVFILAVFIVKPVNLVAFDLKKNASASVDSSEDIQRATNDILNVAQEEAACIQSTSSALDEITAMVNQSAEQAKSSGEKAESSSLVAVNGKRAIEEVATSMKDITHSAREIEDNVKNGNERLKNIVSIIQQINEKTAVINDIVFQTKLLSFNASVEAARAGEHGKGFAVVAEEVGNLAQMSGTSAAEINALLQSSTQEVESAIDEINRSVQGAVNNALAVVEKGNESVQNCEQTLDEIVANVDEVKTQMDSIMSAASEQQIGINEISKSVHEINSSSQKTTQIAGAAHESAKNIVAKARSLNQMAESLEERVMGSKKAAELGEMRAVSFGEASDSEDQAA